MAEKEKMKDKVQKILNHNCNVFINRQLIYNYPEQLFADAGVMAIIELKVTPQKEKGFDEITEKVMMFGEVSSVYLMAGGYATNLE